MGSETVQVRARHVEDMSERRQESNSQSSSSDDETIPESIKQTYGELSEFERSQLNCHEEINEPDVPYKREIVWRNVYSMIFIHGVAFYGYLNMAFHPDVPWYGMVMVDFFARFASMGVLAGSHRLWSHRAYKAKLPLRILLMIMQTMSLQNDIYDWCRDHRLHHKHSDTNADPYNARRGFFFSHMGWLMVRKHPNVIKKGKTIELSDVWADPVVRFQRRFYIPLVLLLWGAVPTYLTYWVTGVGFLECFFGSVIFRYVFSLHYAWLVNSAAHLYGYQMYDKNLEPRENRFVIYTSLGEGYHNYHHAFPWDYSASEHGWARNFNPATLFIDICAKLGQAYDLRKPDPNLIRKRTERTGSPQERKKFFNLNVIIDYTFGFLVSYFMLLFTLGLRFLINGQI